MKKWYVGRLFCFFVVLLALSGCGVNIESITAKKNPVDDNASKIVSIETAADGSGNSISSINLFDRSEDLELYLLEENESEKRNVEANWVLSGSIGDLIITEGGKKARFTNFQVGTGYLKVTYGNTVKQVDVTIVANEAPSIVFSEPTGSDDIIALNSSFAIQWSDQDADDNANISIYLHTSNAGVCANGTLVTDSLQEDADGLSGNYSWDSTGTPTGNYFLCASINDALGNPVVAWSDSIKINTAPSITVTEPSGGDDSIISGETFSIQWSDSDPDHDAQISLYYNTTNSGACNTGTLIASALSENSDASSGSYDFDSSGLDSGAYYICARIDDGLDSTEVYSEALSVTGACEWTGELSSDWADAGNWSGCGGSVPSSTSYVRMKNVGFSPIVSADASVLGFVSGGSDTEITINAGVVLSVYGIEDGFRGDVSFKGSSGTCTTCLLEIRKSQTLISEGASLTIKPGAYVKFRDIYSVLKVGNSSSPGHLVIQGGVDASYYPQFYYTNKFFKGIVVEGTPAQKSSVYIDGAKLELYAGFSGDVKAIRFVANYEVKKLDRIQFLGGGYASTIALEDCDNATISDTTWEDFEFPFIPFWAPNVPKRSINVEAISCTAATPLITISNASGWGWGSVFEKDPNNRIHWSGDETAVTCTWSGASDTDWFNSGNWNNCANGRNGYPDQFDKVILDDSVTNQPILTKDAFVQGLESSSLSGSLTINEGVKLYIADGSFKQSLSLSAGTDNCSSCRVYSESFRVLNNKTLRLNNAIILLVHSGGGLALGDGTSSGHLVTNTSDLTDINKWPRLGGYYYYFKSLVLNGLSPTEQSTVNINGLKITDYYSGEGMIVFEKNYKIASMNSVQLDLAFSSFKMNDAYINLKSCSGATFTDVTWSNFDFVDIVESGVNVDASSCSGIGPITIEALATGSNSGFGSGFENDPNNIISWSP